MKSLSMNGLAIALTTGLFACSHAQTGPPPGNVFRASSATEFFEVCARENRHKCALYVTRPACLSCRNDELGVFDPLSAQRPDVTFVKVYYQDTRSFYQQRATPSWGKQIQARVFVFASDGGGFRKLIKGNLRSKTIPAI